MLIAAYLLFHDCLKSFSLLAMNNSLNSGGVGLPTQTASGKVSLCTVFIYFLRMGNIHDTSRSGRGRPSLLLCPEREESDFY